MAPQKPPPAGETRTRFSVNNSSSAALARPCNNVRQLDVLKSREHVRNGNGVCRTNGITRHINALTGEQYATRR
jgi:hypothetical protein